MTRRIGGMLFLLMLLAVGAADQVIVAARPFAASAVAAEPATATPNADPIAPPHKAADTKPVSKSAPSSSSHAPAQVDYWSLLFVLALSTLIGLGVIVKVSRLLHTPLMSLTNAISAIAVVGAIIVAGGEDHPVGIRVLGFIALFASTTNIVSGFMITDRMLKMFKQPSKDAKP